MADQGLSGDTEYVAPPSPTTVRDDWWITKAVRFISSLVVLLVFIPMSSLIGGALITFALAHYSGSCLDDVCYEFKPMEFFSPAPVALGSEEEKSL